MGLVENWAARFYRTVPHGKAACLRTVRCCNFASVATQAAKNVSVLTLRHATRSRVVATIGGHVKIEGADLLPNVGPAAGNRWARTTNAVGAPHLTNPGSCTWSHSMKHAVFFLFLLAVTAGVQAKLVTKSVAYEQGGVKLVGYLAYDDSTQAPRPGVLVVPEWWGLTDFAKGEADKLAGLGYVAFAVDMYGAGVTTTDPKKAGELAGQFYGKPLMAERAQAGLDQLVKTGLASPAKLAAIGYCFGGATCQALAYSGAPLVGIVSFHGSLIPASSESAAKNKAKFLICHGAIDPFTKPEAIEAFKKSLDDGHFDYQFISYAGAVHAFTNPGADALRVSASLDGIGYNEAAARRSWQHMKLFFDEIFAK